ncbi:Tetratricopeptide repeat-containing protein [Leishmania donovani]|uniref:Tetratricopeptide repeat family protein n=1 Tax=Leishmania donovani TaxID=5661 RepID=A0A504XI44_LEIDO|nr:Tetratricopeptide repeat family protein [Leishmania donovani]CAJ1991938.1 Tetratricopeptide repeat-containing protein [Leishmania donovani]VDZ47775.1 Tetratricopeptide_repeat_putative/Pfam:PF07719/Pfam:PF00515 [Leishmania donovani]
MNARQTQVACVTVVIGGLLCALSYAVYRQLSQNSAAIPDRKAHVSESPVQPPAVAAGAQASTPPPQAPISLPVESPCPAADKARALELLNVLKQNANIAFQEGRFEDALRGYQDCIEVTSVLGAADAEAVATEQIVRANVAMVCIRMHEYDAARAVATMLLQDAAIALPEDLKVKVLYRRGLASKALNDRAAALADFKAAVHFSKDHRNPAVEKEIALLQRGGA